MANDERYEMPLFDDETGECPKHLSASN
eukprot:SAG31_NODE_16246_length_717_cov_0.834951_1_plen_27_part_10